MAANKSAKNQKQTEESDSSKAETRADIDMKEIEYLAINIARFAKQTAVDARNGVKHLDPEKPLKSLRPAELDAATEALDAAKKALHLGGS